jgi:uncharacterized protein (TIGR02145 family)
MSSKRLLTIVLFLFSLNLRAQQFPSAQIGSQTWMPQNLNIDTFRNGDKIPQAKTAEEWKTAGDSGKPAWCYYQNDSNNASKYGKLYNAFASNDPRGLAPKGWRVATENDWQILVKQLGGSKTAGFTLKSKEGWKANGNGSNQTGFAAVPGGNRDENGNFMSMGYACAWWCYPTDKSEAMSYILNFRNAEVGKVAVDSRFGLSIRCLKEVEN